MKSSSDILHGNILIVDDMEVNILLLERMLRNAGYTSVNSTLNPLNVCELYRKNHYDLILLDLQMPEMDGFEVMKNLKAVSEDYYPAVMVITSEPEYKERALKAGAKDFITKPFELIEVLTRVHNMMEASLLLQEVAEHKDDNPALSNVIQRNIRKIIHIRQKAASEQSLQDRIANAMTTFSGSMWFFYVHIIWFLVWFFLNTGHLRIAPFDPYPYGFLTMVVSLEAIFLATFVLISQNLIAKETEHLTDLGLQTSLLTEHELTRVLQMLHAIQRKIGIINDDDSNLADADLEMETKPEIVLAEIERLQQRAIGGRSRLEQ
jgi:uncharacterized membrane protein